MDDQVDPDGAHEQFDRAAEVIAVVVGCLFTALGSLEIVGSLLLADPEHGQPGPHDSVIDHVTFYGLPGIAVVCGIIGIVALPHDRYGIYASFTLASAIAAVTWLLGG